MRDYVGTVVAERYALVKLIGRGGHGVVYKAWDRVAERHVAVKMLSDGFETDRTYAARLAREQDALLALTGTSAVAVYDLARAPNGALCLVMEFLEGTDLEHHLSEYEERGERLSLDRLSWILEPIVETLERAHDAEILHRDLKPANVFLLANDAGVRLFDFGLSRRKTDLRLTIAGTVMGSPSYIAPEVWKGQSDDLDHRVDVYSLGVILFRALSGELPFDGKSLYQSFQLATTAPRPSLIALRPELPLAIDGWVQKALAIDRDARFHSVHALWNGLFAALAYSPPPRPYRPVADSLITAWKSATHAFRRFIDSAAAAVPKARHLAVSAPSMDAIDEGWAELTDDEIEHPPSAATRSDDAWAEVHEEELDRPSILAEKPPASIRPETAAIDDAWEDVGEEDLDRASLYSAPAPDAGSTAPSAPQSKRVQKKGTKRGGKRTQKPSKKAAAATGASKAPVTKARKTQKPKKAAKQKSGEKQRRK